MYFFVFFNIGIIWYVDSYYTKLQPKLFRRVCTICPSNIQSTLSYEKTKHVKATKALLLAQSIISLYTMKVNADEEVSPECSESISVLTNGNKKVIVIGTAHISEESAKLVERTIRKVNPNTVMIELDPKRIENFSNITALANYGFDTPAFALSEERSYQTDNQLLNRQPNLFVSIINSIKSIIGEAFQVLSGALLGTLLSQFYRSIEKLGFTAGGEFKTAIKEARKVGARILLGDRDVDITLQHLSTALAAYPTER
jgi:hypothetical protein